MITIFIIELCIGSSLVYQYLDNNRKLVIPHVLTLVIICLYKFIIIPSNLIVNTNDRIILFTLILNLIAIFSFIFDNKFYAYIGTCYISIILLIFGFNY